VCLNNFYHSGRRAHAPQDTTVRLRASLCAAIFHRTNRSNATVLYGSNGDLPGDTPGVTRYPHPESNNTLKSKAPASGAPARLRVFCLTPCSISLPNSASSSAPASPQGSGRCTAGWPICRETYGSAGESSPDPKSGGCARATTLGHGPAPFPPDAGAQEIETDDERLIEARDQAFCRSAIFPCQKIADREKRKFGAHRRAENLWRVSAQRYPHDPIFVCAIIAYT